MAGAPVADKGFVRGLRAMETGRDGISRRLVSALLVVCVRC